MALNAHALCTLNAAKAFLQPGGMTASDDPRLEEVINRASTLIERWCGRPFAKASYPNRRLRGRAAPDYFVLHTPIAVSQPLTVTVDGVVQTVWKTETDGDPASYMVVVTNSCEDPTFTPDVLYRAAGWCAPSGLSSNVLLTYSGGFALTPTVGYPPIPDDLEEAALEVVKKLWNDQAKGIQDITTVTMPSGSLNVFDPGLPRRAIDLLNPFRRMVVA